MLIVQKYGGATLADAGNVRAVAERIAKLSQQGHRIVAVVSAMGSTTNELISLAKQVSTRPTLREMDMLLTTGERISMSLLSMALNHLGVRATSLTGSQAGILTDDSHSNAFIQDIKAFRVEEALDKGHVVVLAGFQGVSPVTKEITTLGRGGTDTTAIAMAAFLKADHCEILKEVPAVFSADPRLVPSAIALTEIGYEAMAEMTFWGAKVLHYRSVELATRSQVPVYVGPAHSLGNGTWIRSLKGSPMYEQLRVLSLNSYEKVLILESTQESLSKAISGLEHEWELMQVPTPQLIAIEQKSEMTRVTLTGPAEVLEAIESWIAAQKKWQLIKGQWSSVTATCTGSTAPALARDMSARLEAQGIQAVSCHWSAMSLSFMVPAGLRISALQALHPLIVPVSI